MKPILNGKHILKPFARGILACRDDGQWPAALALLAESEQQQVRPDAPMLNAVMGVCGCSVAS